MKKSMALFVALILAFACAVSAADAGGIGDRLEKLRTRIGTAVAGNEDSGDQFVVEKLVRKLVDNIAEKCRENGVDPEEVLDQVMGLITDEYKDVLEPGDV